MRVHLECFPCFLRQATIALKLAGADQREQREVIHAVLDEIKKTDITKPPAWTTTFIHRKIREILKRDPFEEVKSRYNRIGLTMYDSMKEFVHESKDPLWTATRIAIAGNIIDFGIFTSVDIENTIKRALTERLSVDDYDRFKEEISKTDEILYLLDNAGEIVFDKILIEVLNAMGKRVISVVKGSPVLNDSTLKDAMETSLHEITTVIDNGSDAIGTILEFTSPQFRKVFHKAPLIISKGQGNFETLQKVDSKKIFFAFQIKCEVLSKETGLAKGSMLLSFFPPFV